MFKDKIKAMVVNENEKGSKKKMENIVVFIVILIVTVIAINSIWNGEKDNQNKQTEIINNRQTISRSYRGRNKH